MQSQNYTFYYWAFYISFSLYFWEQAPISSWSQGFRDVNSVRSFEGLPCLHLWGHTVQEEVICCSSETLANTPPTGTQSHPWRPKSSATPLWELQILHRDSMTATYNSLRNGHLWMDVCTLTFWTCPASAVSQQNLQTHWWMTRKQLLFPASVNRNILIHEVVLQTVGYKQCKQFILLLR